MNAFPMEKKKKLGRGLEEVSHLFLSSQATPDSVDTPGRAETDRGETGGEEFSPAAFFRPDPPLPKIPRVENRASRIIIYGDAGFNTEKSFLACNLALELSRRGFSVGLLESNAWLPNALFLLGPLLSGQTGETEPVRLLTAKMLALPPAVPFPEPGKVTPLPLNEGKTLKLLFLPGEEVKPAGSAPSLKELAVKTDILIVNSPADAGRLKEIAAGESYFLIPFGTGIEDILRCYAAVRRLITIRPGARAGMLVMKEKNRRRAESGFKLIAQMTGKFCPLEMSFLGSIPPGEEYVRSILNRLPLALETEPSPLSGAIRMLADCLLEETRAHTAGPPVAPDG